MTRFFVILCFLSVIIPAGSQVLHIRDIVSRLPLEAVAVYSESHNKHTTTDAKGRTDISSFVGMEDITIRLLGYRTEVFTYEELRVKQFRVLLESTEISLDEIVVSATRWQQKKRDVPSKITTILKKDVILENPQTAADLLNMSGKVYIQKSQLGGGSPMIRGFATNRVLITVDGVRMNNAIFRSGNLQNVISINPMNIESTEILFGPGAVMYGSDAIGGAMNFYTTEPRLRFNGNPVFSGNFMGRYSTANGEKTGHIDLRAGTKKWAFVTAATFSDFDHLKTGKYGPDEFLRPDYVTRIDDRDTVLKNSDPQVQVPSGYSQLNLMQKVRFAPNEDLDFQYGFHYSATSDVPRYDRLIERNSEGDLRDGQWYYGPQKWMMNVLNITYNEDHQIFDNLKTTIAWQQFEESRHNRNFGSNNLNHRTEGVNAWSLNLDFEKVLDERKSILYGVETVLNTISSVAERENILTQVMSPLSTRYPDGSLWYSGAVYANFLNRASEKITFQTGLRYNLIGYEAEFDNSFYPFPFDGIDSQNGALTGSAGLAYKPTEDWQFNLNLSTGFRAPNIDDAAKVFDSEPGNVMVPNPNLKPEYAWNVDFGVIRIINNKIKLDLTGFYTYLENAMVRRDFLFNGLDSIEYDGQLSRVLAIQNAASAWVYGVQTALEVKLTRELVLISRLTWQNGKEELDNGATAPLRHAVPLFGVTRLTWSKNKLKAEVYAQYQGEISFDEMPPSERAKAHLYAMDSNGNPFSPGWITLNLKTLYQLKDYLLVTAGLENITNALYRPYSSGISAPGTNLVLAVRASF
jgi:hemoglobin/transferrin/lactoferrin receptor protein